MSTLPTPADIHARIVADTPARRQAALDAAKTLEGTTR